MPTRVCLTKQTDRGIKGVKKQPEAIEQSLKELEPAMGKLIGFYLLMGGE